MTRLEARFRKLKKLGETALVTYIMAGYPDLESSRRLVGALAEAGADVIEIGIPFSDPLADGPVIQHAGEIALRNGTTTDSVFELVRQARATTDVPLVLMTYYNVVLRYGLEAFAREAAAAGADGVIIPDLPPEEGGAWVKAARAKGLATIFLIAPTSSDVRIKAAARVSTGFVYCVALLGVTGSRKGPSADLANLLQRVRAVTKMPLAVGFGVATGDQAREIARSADGVIVGSAILEKISERDAARGVAAVATFINEIKAALLPF